MVVISGYVTRSQCDFNTKRFLNLNGNNAAAEICSNSESKRIPGMFQIQKAAAMLL